MLINTINTQNNTLSTSFKLGEVKKSFKSHRVKTYTRGITENDRVKAAAGSIIGTAIPVVLMMKKQKIKNPIKLKYGLREMVAVSAGSIIGGVSMGLLGEEKEVQNNRLKEGIFQFMNAIVPTCVVGYLMKLCETSTKYNTKANKILAIIGGLTFGMFSSAALANLITDPMDKHPDRKVNFKDAIVNIDDGLGALVLANIPIVEKLHVAGFLPLIYASCGYRAGKSN